MKVLHVIPSVSVSDGGPSRAIAAIEQGLTAAGIEVTTLTTDHAGLGQRLTSDHKPSVHNAAHRVYARKWTDLYKIAPDMVPWLWQNVGRFDVIHIHALFSFASVAAARIARLKNVPYIIRPLGTLGAYGVSQRRPLLKRASIKLLEGPILEHAALVHFTSKSELEEAQLLGLRFEGAVIPLGVMSPVADTPGMREAARSGRAKRILFLSRIDAKKNLEGLLQAFATVALARPKIMLQIAGSGDLEYVARLKAQAEALSIADRVEWLGHVGGDVKRQLFENADMFALPSFSENFGIACVEAMLSGLPCILSEGVGIAQDASNAEACLVSGTEPDQIVSLLFQLVDDDKRLRLMGQRAREFAEHNYSTAVMANRLIEVYSSICSARKGEWHSSLCNPQFKG
jgi:glycosyltransferase involved in cell wall biosynthesis